MDNTFANKSELTANPPYSRYLCGFLCLTALLLSFSQSPLKDHHYSALLMAIALLGCGVELLSIALPTWGRFSLGTAFWIYLGLNDNFTPPQAMVLASLTATVSCLHFGAQAQSRKLFEAEPAEIKSRTLTEILLACSAIIFSLSASSLIHYLNVVRPENLPLAEAGVGLVVFGLIQAFLPTLLEPRLGALDPQEAGLRLHHLSILNCSCYVVGAAMVFFSPQPSLKLLPFIILLWPLRSAAQLLSQSLLSHTNRRLSRSLNYTSRQLKEAVSAREMCGQELSKKIEEVSAQQILSQTLAQCRSLSQLWQQGLTLAKLRIKANTVVIFDCRASHPLPVSFSSPDMDLLSGWALTKPSEAIVELTWQNQKGRKPEELWEKQTSFPKEKRKATELIANFGVIYVGRQSALPFSQQELYYLQLIAELISLYGPNCIAIEQSGQEVAQLSQSNRQLDAWAEKLEKLFKNIRQTFNIAQPQALLDDIENLVKTVIDCDYLCLVLGKQELISTSEETYHHAEPSSNPTWLRHRGPLPAPIEEIHLAVCHNALPLIINDFTESRFQPPTPDTGSLLAVPVLHDQDLNKSLLVGSCKPGAFTRQDQDLLFMLSYHLGAFFHSQQLHEELQVAHQNLKESQANLIQSSKMAAIGQLAAGLAHELNTPLGAVILGLDSASINISNRPQRALERLVAARKAAWQAQDIVKKLLFYARSSHSGRQMADVSQVIEDTLELISFQLKKSQITVEKDLPELPKCCLNPGQLQQVLTNLLLNARDALNKQETSRLIAIKASTSAQHLVINVSDNGDGIDPQVMPHIFEPFFTTKAVGSGTGLGLSVSREIIQNMGGQLEASSTAQGSTFTITLPLKGPDTPTN